MSSSRLPALPLPQDFYKQRERELRFELEETVKQQGAYRRDLVVLGLIACALLYQSIVAKSLPLWSPGLAVPVFAYLGTRSKRCHQRGLKLFRLVDYYDRGNSRLAHECDKLDEGRDFIDPNHFYATDLDLFGRGSLFQLLCSARTQAGRETLANWMKKPAAAEEILARHAAISELRGRSGLREALASTGTMEASNCRPETFRTWVTATTQPFASWAPALAPFLVVTVLMMPVLYGFGLIGLKSLWLGMATMATSEIVFAGIFLTRVKSVSDSIGPLVLELPIISEILGILECQHFASAKLAAIAGQLEEARSHVGNLQRLIRLQRERDNAWFTLFSYFLLWGTQFAMAIDQWRRSHGAQMLEWLAALGELEALISLSAYAYEHPRDVFPEFMELEFMKMGAAIEAEGMGHPLLEESACTRNDFELRGDVQFLIVSGSNMSGKSTFLRAIGLNAVLARMGAPVRCTKFRLSPFEIGAAIRMEDSVVDGRSHFLAQMQRLRRMIDVASEGPLLYLADEIMSGTNSNDRRIATEWVVRALVLRGAIGVITTHDLALTEIASNGLPGRNVHFEDTGELGNLTFDYKLRPGLLTHSNALNIAHMLGIDAAATSNHPTGSDSSAPSHQSNS